MTSWQGGFASGFTHKSIWAESHSLSPGTQKTQERVLHSPGQDGGCFSSVPGAFLGSDLDRVRPTS